MCLCCGVGRRGSVVRGGGALGSGWRSREAPHPCPSLLPVALSCCTGYYRETILSVTENFTVSQRNENIAAPGRFSSHDANGIESFH